MCTENRLELLRGTSANSSCGYNVEVFSVGERCKLSGIARALILFDESFQHSCRRFGIRRSLIWQLELDAAPTWIPITQTVRAYLDYQSGVIVRRLFVADKVSLARQLSDKFYQRPTFVDHNCFAGDYTGLAKER